MTLRLSILDQSIALTGRPQAASIRETLDLACHAERLGYHRFWVAEHHNHETIVGTAPEILMAAIAAQTRRIRIGSAGVMLPHYSAFKVAEQFRVLDALAPGRIDLGVGRAPGSDGRTAFALNPDAQNAAEAFPRQVRDLEHWVTGTALPEGHPFRGVSAYPKGQTSPDIWILGSSDYGAQVAAHFGLPYCFAHFITDGRGTAEALSLYRRLYRPSERFPEPIATICVWALAVETEERARRMFLSRAKWKVLRDRGIWGALESPEEVLAAPLADADLERIDVLYRQGYVGEAIAVAEKLRALARCLELDELVVLTWAHDPMVRRRSYELLAAALELPRSSVNEDQVSQPELSA